MTAIDKANELIVKVLIKFERITLIEAKKIVLIAVDEILNENSIREGNNDEIITYEPYWLKVKQEIEKL